MECQTGQTFPPEWVQDQGAPDWTGGCSQPTGSRYSSVQKAGCFHLPQDLGQTLNLGWRVIPDQPLNLATRTMPQHPDMHTARQAFPTLSQCLLSPFRALVAQRSCRDVAQGRRSALPPDGFGGCLALCHALQQYCIGVQVGPQADGLQHGKQMDDTVQAALWMRRDGGCGNRHQQHQITASLPSAPSPVESHPYYATPFLSSKPAQRDQWSQPSSVHPSKNC